MTQFVINLDDADTRLDHFVTLKFPNLSRSQLKKLIEDGFVLVNGNTVKSGFNLRPNDIVESRIEEYEVAPAYELEAQDIPLEIIYEDDDLLVINKNATMVVHPGHGNERDTLVNALLFHCKGKISKLGGDDRPGIVHRLDKGTSGLIVCAKTDLAHRHLAKQFEERSAFRVYQAICWFPFEEKKGSIATYLGRKRNEPVKQSIMPNEKSGKYALTRYIVQEEFPFLSVVRFKLETGRTHQIRAHCEYIHHPVFADEIYSGDDRQLKSIHLHYQKFAHGLFKYINRQALHAFRLEFIHPVSLEKMAFEVALPEDMQTVIEKCRNKFSQKE